MQNENILQEENEVLIQVQDLRKSFGTLSVLDGISTDIRKGEKIVVVGPSGSGKSTFLRCLNCLEDPSGGAIVFENENLADPRVNINIHRQKMGMVFQQFNLFNNKNVLENIMLSPVLLRKKELARQKRFNFFFRRIEKAKKRRRTFLCCRRSPTKSLP